MSRSRTARYFRASGAVALSAGLLLVGLSSARGPAAVAWAVVGWGVMALAGVAGGAWIVSRHGRPGSGFLVAVGACMLARLFAGAAAAVAAASAGMSAVWAFLAGAGVTYVALQVFELSWFLRHPAPQARRAG